MSPPTEAASAGAPAGARRGSLDWLRGVAVLIMVEAHVFDSWILPAERARPGHGWAMLVGGMGAPAFLFLAGVAASLAAGSRARRGLSPAQASASVQRRGWQIFLYAFLFRFQAWAVNPGARLAGLLKVDILNVMGPSIVATAALWRVAASDLGRFAVLAAATLAVAMLTPIVRASDLVGLLPDPIEWYVRPVPGTGTFTLLPWGAFVLAGGVLGVVLTPRRDWRGEWLVHGGIAAAGLALTLGSYALSFRPSIYREASFWTTSPTYLGIRVGLLLLAVAVAFVWSRRPWRRADGWSPLETFGIGSLFVYWIHIELVYGWPATALKRQLTLEQTALAFLAFVGVLYLLLSLWTRSRPARQELWRSWSAKWPAIKVLGDVKASR